MSEKKAAVEAKEPKSTEKKCKVKKCKRPYRAKGYCVTHFKKWRAGELPKAPYKICAKEACRKKRFKGSLCEEHSKGAPVAAAAAPETAPAGA